MVASTQTSTKGSDASPIKRFFFNRAMKLADHVGRSYSEATVMAWLLGAFAALRQWVATGVKPAA